jgi:Tfp pilus assembly protein PilF/TolB-like protein
LRATRAFAIASAVCAIALPAAAQYPFVPPPVPCIPQSEGPGILAGVAPIRASEIPRRHLAVLQFTELPARGEPDAALEGMRDRIFARLRDMRPRALREYVGPKQIRSDAPQERLIELTTVGKELNSEHLLVGRYAQSGGEVEIFLEVFDAATGQRLWEATRTDSISDLLQVEPALARLIAAHEFGAASVADSIVLSQRETDDGVAYVHYLRGVAYLNDSTTLKDATVELEAATQRAPKMAVAYAALATAFTRRAATMQSDTSARTALLHLATAAANRATELAPKSAESWIAQGTVLAGGAPQRLTSARTAFERALLLDPANAEAHRRLGRVLFLQGSGELAQSHLLRAVSLEPENPSPLVDLGELELNLHAFGQSCRALDLALSIDARIARAYELRAIARLHRGDVRPAWVDAETGRRLGAEIAGQATAVLVDVAAHDTASARSRIRTLRREVDLKKSLNLSDAGYVALGLAAVGDHSAALDVLERARPRDAELYAVLHRPGFDRLWADIRFRRLLEASGAGVAK